MSLRTACNHCNTPMKSRVKHQEIAGAPEDLSETANILPSPKAKQGHSPRRTRMSHRNRIAVRMGWRGKKKKRNKKKVMQVSINNVLLLKNSLQTWRAQAPAAAPRQGSAGSVWRSIRWPGGDESGVKKKSETILLSLYGFLSEMCLCAAASSTIWIKDKQTKFRPLDQYASHCGASGETRCSSSQRAAWPWWG